MSQTVPAIPEIDWLQEAAKIAELEKAQPPRQGTPSILEDTYRVNRFLIAMADGNYKSVAANVAGFARETLFHLERKAKDGYLPAIAFFNAMEKAESVAEADMVGCINKAARSGPQFWAAAMTKLERRQPDRWGKRQDDSSVPKVVVQIGTHSGDVSVSLSPGPQSPQSESSQIPSVILSESDKLDYVNEPKSLTGQTIDVPERNTSEGPAAKTGSRRRGDRKGTLPRSVASRQRTGRSEAKGGA